MDRLIKVLEDKIDDLVSQLTLAKQEIEHLKASPNSSVSSAPSDASLDLLSSMSQRRSTEEQLQLYIEDSLDLLNPTEPNNLAANNQTTFNFDLLHTALEDQPTEDNQETKDSPMTTEQQTTITADIQETAATEVEQNETTSTPSETPETASLSAEEKRRQKNQKNNRRLIKMLEDRYPKAFDWNNPRPLKVGIDKDMTLDEEFNASKQKRAMAAYTRSDRYKKCLQSGQPRIDLEGVAVSDEPALPNAKKAAAETKKPMPKHNKGKRPQGNKPQTNKGKGQQRPTNKERNQPKQDPQFDNLSPEERMKAKLALLTNKK